MIGVGIGGLDLGFGLGKAKDLGGKMNTIGEF